MKSLVVVIIALTCSLSTFAQDSLRVKDKIRLYDSLSRVGQRQFNMDSLTSISWRDSLRSKIHISFNKDSLAYKDKIDSLQQRGLPTSPYSEKLDSAIQKRNSMVEEVNNKQQDPTWSKCSPPPNLVQVSRRICWFKCCAVDLGDGSLGPKMVKVFRLAYLHALTVS